jgi:hypothetical protein
MKRRSFIQAALAALGLGAVGSQFDFPAFDDGEIQNQRGITSHIYESFKAQFWPGLSNRVDEKKFTIALVNSKYPVKEGLLFHSSFEDVKKYQVRARGYKTGGKLVQWGKNPFVEWPNATITASGAVIYQQDPQGSFLVGYINFNGKLRTWNGDYRIEFPEQGMLELT